MPPAGLVLSVLSNPHASVLASPKWWFNIRFQLSSGFSKMQNFKSAFRNKNILEHVRQKAHILMRPYCIFCLLHATADIRQDMRPSMSVSPGHHVRGCVSSIIEQVNKNIAIGNCKLAKSQKETTTNNKSGHARQRGAQRNRNQSSHLFCYCYSHSAPQCMSCPLHRICVLRPQINDFAGLPTGRTYILRRLHNQLHANPPGDLGCSCARATSSGIRHDCAGPPLCVYIHSGPFA